MPPNTNSVVFNGTSNYGFGNQNNWAFPITNSYTVECWLKPSALGTLVHFFHKGDRYQVASGWYVAKDNALLRFGYRNASVSYEGTVNVADHLAVGVWTHLCLTFDYPTRVLTLYVNGGEAARTGTLAVAPGDYTTMPFRVATVNPENAERYAGQVDEVRVWSVCRTATQIRAYWNKQALGTEPGLYAWYPLNLASGTVDNNRRVGSGNLPALEFFGGTPTWTTDVAPITTAGYADQVLTDAPRGYWRLGEASGTTCLDSSGNGLNGTYGPAPTLAQAGALAGDPDPAASFSQAALSQASIPYNALLNLTSAWTVECWAYVRNVPPSGIGGAFFSDLYPGTEAAVQQMLGFDYLVANQGKIMTGFYSAPNGWLTAVAPTTCPLNQWVHWAGVYSGAAGTLSLYQNGALVATTGSLPSFAPNKTNSNKWIGRRWDMDEHPDAVLDEVALYPTALSSARILAHYQAGLPVAPITQQRWTGSAWAPTATQRWTGSQWVAAQVKRWNGSSWV